MDPPCLAALSCLEHAEESPVNAYRTPQSPSEYFPLRAIKALFEQEPNGITLEGLFLCSCRTCTRDGGPIDERAAYFNSWRKRQLQTDYATIYALLIYLRRPGLIRKFQMHELRLNDSRYLRADDFRTFQNVEDFKYIKKKILERQYSFHVRVLKPCSDIIVIPEEELLPIKENLVPSGTGSFAEVRCFEFQHTEYRSSEFGKVISGLLRYRIIKLTTL